MEFKPAPELGLDRIESIKTETVVMVHGSRQEDGPRDRVWVMLSHTGDVITRHDPRDIREAQESKRLRQAVLDQERRDSDERRERALDRATAAGKQLGDAMRELADLKEAKAVVERDRDELGVKLRSSRAERLELTIQLEKCEERLNGKARDRYCYEWDRNRGEYVEISKAARTRRLKKEAANG